MTNSHFRGSRLDHALGNSIAVAAVAVPPFVYGMAGLMLSMVFVNLFLARSLFRTPDPHRRIPMKEQMKVSCAHGAIVVDGMRSLAEDFKEFLDYSCIEPGQAQLGLLEGLDPKDLALALAQTRAHPTLPTMDADRHIRMTPHSYGGERHV